MKRHVLMVNSGKTHPIRRLERDPSIALTVVTEGSYRSHYSPATELRIVADIGDVRQVYEAALDVLRERPIDYVVSPSERSLQAGGYLRSFLGLPGITYEVANAFSNKFVMKQQLAAVGVPVTPFALLRRMVDLPDLAAGLGWPVVVKPLLGSGTTHTVVVHSPDDAARLLAMGPAGGHPARCPLIAERFVEVEAEFQCDGVVCDGEVVFASVGRYFAPVLDMLGSTMNGSYLLPAGSPDRKEIVDLHQAVVAALGLHDGVTHLEVFRSGTGYLVGEVTCRPGGGATAELVHAHHGVDIWEAFLLASTGRRPAIAARFPHDILAMYHLPARPGRVVDVSSPEDLSALPGVVEASVQVAPGDTIGGNLHSAMMAGYVLFRVDAEEAVAPAAARIAGQCRCEVEEIE